MPPGIGARCSGTAVRFKPQDNTRLGSVPLVVHRAKAEDPPGPAEAGALTSDQGSPST